MSFFSTFDDVLNQKPPLYVLDQRIDGWFIGMLVRPLDLRNQYDGLAYGIGSDRAVDGEHPKNAKVKRSKNRSVRR